MGKEKRKAEESLKKQQSGPATNKAPLPKYTNYHALNAPQDHIYTVIDKSLDRKPDAIKSNRSHRDFKKNCAFHKDRIILRDVLLSKMRLRGS